MKQRLFQEKAFVHELIGKSCQMGELHPKSEVIKNRSDVHVIQFLFEGTRTGRKTKGKVDRNRQLHNERMQMMKARLKEK